MSAQRLAAVHDDSARTRRYERLIRAYPRWWRAQHGEALLGILLDSHGDAHPMGSAIQALDLTWRGLAIRTTTALPADTRSTLASVALAVGFTFSLAELAVYGWLRYTNWFEGIGGTIWFPAAWLLLIAATATRLPAVRAAAWLLTIAVFIGVPVLHLGPLLIVPWSTSLAPIGTHGVAAGGFEVLWRHGLPPSTAYDAVQVVLATVTLISAPRRRTTLIAALVAGPLLGITLGVFGIVPVSSPSISEGTFWLWPALLIRAFFGPVTAGATVALALIARAAARKHPTGAAIVGLAALTTLTAFIALILSGPVDVTY